MTTKGGNYLAGNSPIEKRNKGDFYQTPYHCTRMLLDAVPFLGSILEPACGKGAITSILKDYGHNPISYDIEKDFLTETKEYDNLITNPPFKLANQFIMKAKEVAQKKIAMILPINYLQGKKRYETVFQDTEFPLTEVLVFTRYLFMKDTIREDGTCACGMITYAWFIWEKKRGKRDPILKWLDNNAFIRS